MGTDTIAARTAAKSAEIDEAELLMRRALSLLDDAEETSSAIYLQWSLDLLSTAGQPTES